MKRLILLAWMMIAALGLASPASAGKGLGPLYNVKYNSYGIVATDQSVDGAVEMTTERINTINCGGCDETWYGPGSIFHLRNTGKQPICVSLEFTPEDGGLHNWGSGDTYYLKGRQRLEKVGGLYSIATGGTERINLSLRYTIRTWEPVAKKKC